MFYVPLERLIVYPKVNRLCDNVDMMKALIANSVRLNRNGSAVKVGLLDKQWATLPEIQGLSSSGAHLEFKLCVVIIQVTFDFEIM